MQKIDQTKILRIIDANYNRIKEGLRVCEDICRFVYDQKLLTKKFKEIRHEVTDIVLSLKMAKMIATRNIEKDVGRGSTEVELKRCEINDIFYANIQRSKESLRVLEELMKLVNKGLALRLKECRYAVYGLEKKVIERF
jgi:hypothetical protein